nr:cobaltochelatase subunit CobN [Methanosarcina horonobensis]
MINKHLRDENRYPENVGFYWMANDVMWADGEGMAQMMSLLGVEPVWLSNGHLKGSQLFRLKSWVGPELMLRSGFQESSGTISLTVWRL